jgi:hypothetical protein
VDPVAKAKRKPKKTAGRRQGSVVHHIGPGEIVLGGTVGLGATMIGRHPFRKSQGDRITNEIAREAFPPDGVPPATFSNGQVLQCVRPIMKAHGILDISDTTVLRRFGRRKSRQF